MKSAALAFALLLAAGGLLAQEVDLPPIVVDGTFELAPRRSVTDSFTQHLLKQLETHRALKEAAERAPWYDAPLWKYLPRIESSSIDPAQFFKPQYLSLENQRADWELRKLEKQSLFGP